MAIVENMKPTVERLLARGGPARLARTVGTRRDTVLAYHNVLPDGTESGGDDALHLPWSRFLSHLDALEADYEVVSLARILDDPEPDGDASRVAITFDDAYRGALLVALPELVDRELPATVFVSPGLIGSDHFWWDHVSAPGGGPLRGLSRRVALHRFEGDGRRVVSWARKCGFGEGGVHALARPATLPELDRAADLPGVSYGAHGWWHRTFPAVGHEALEGELERPLRWLGERYGHALPVVAYPYGLASKRAAAATARAGYRAAFRCGGGRMPRTRKNLMDLPRLSMPAGLSADGLRLRLSGILEG